MTTVIRDDERGFFAGFRHTGTGKPALSWSNDIAMAMTYTRDDKHLPGALKRVRQQVKTAKLSEIPA